MEIASQNAISSSITNVFNGGGGFDAIGTAITNAWGDITPIVMGVKGYNSSSVQVLGNYTTIQVLGNYTTAYTYTVNLGTGTLATFTVVIQWKRYLF